GGEEGAGPGAGGGAGGGRGAAVSPSRRRTGRGPPAGRGAGAEAPRGRLPAPAAKAAGSAARLLYGGRRRRRSAASSVAGSWPDGAVGWPTWPYVRREPAAGRTTRESGPAGPVAGVTMPRARA